MKRTVSIIISMMCVATVLLFTSCHSNSNGSDENTSLEQQHMDDPIVGDWILNSSKYTMYSDGVVVDEDSFSDCAGGIGFYDDGSYTRFTANGAQLNGEWSLLNATDDGYYSLYTELTDYLSQLMEVDYSEYAPATHIAILINNQTLETQENFYVSLINEYGDEAKMVIELTSRFERIK